MNKILFGSVLALLINVAVAQVTPPAPQVSTPQATPKIYHYGVEITGEEFSRLNAAHQYLMATDEEIMKMQKDLEASRQEQFKAQELLGKEVRKLLSEEVIKLNPELKTTVEKLGSDPSTVMRLTDAERNNYFAAEGYIRQTNTKVRALQDSLNQKQVELQNSIAPLERAVDKKVLAAVMIMDAKMKTLAADMLAGIEAKKPSFGMPPTTAVPMPSLPVLTK